MVAERGEVELQRLRLHQPVARHVVDHQQCEVGLAGHRAQRGELRAGEAGDVVGIGVGVRHAVEQRLVRRGGQGDVAAELKMCLCCHEPRPIRQIGFAEAGPHGSVAMPTAYGFPRGSRSCMSPPKFVFPILRSIQPGRRAMTAIVDIIAREILDSRGNPTVEVDVRAGGRLARPRRRAVGRLDRRARGGRAARRRQDPLSAARACTRRSRPSTARSSMPSAAWTPRTSAAIDEAMIELDGTPTRAGSAPTPSSACRWRSPRPRPTRSGLPLYRYVGGASAPRAAGADDEHHQRRRACRQPDRLPGIHDHAGRRADASPRPCAWARRSSTR